MSAIQSQQIELGDIQRKMQRQQKIGESNEQAISKLSTDVEKALKQATKVDKDVEKVGKKDNSDNDDDQPESDSLHNYYKMKIKKSEKEKRKKARLEDEGKRALLDLEYRRILRQRKLI